MSIILGWLLISCSSDSKGRSPALDAASGKAPDAGAMDAGGNGTRDAAPSSRPDSGASHLRDAAIETRPDASGRDAASPNDAGTGGGARADAGGPAAGNTCTGTNQLNAFVSDPKLCVYVFAQNVSGARQMAFAPNGDLFVSASGTLVVLWDADQNGTSDANERANFAQANGLNHGVVFSRDAKFVYASSATTVYRWAYSTGRRSAEGAAQTVVRGVPGGGHSSRTLAFDSRGRLIVSVGSAGNVDTSQSDWDTRSQLRRFTLPESLPDDGLAYTTGEVIASGMRNEAGVFVDTDDRIWSVENGRDNLSDADLGGDIHNDNPGEELNLVDGKGPTFYGYPHCFSEFELSSGKGRGTQWADQTLSMAQQKTDAFCQDPAQVRPPVYVMPAHWAPLGILRYSGNALPMKGDLIIASHGSWNRMPAVGRVLARAKLQGDTIRSFEVIVGEKGPSGDLREGAWNVRPVDVQEGPDQAIYFSDDQGNRVLKVGYMN